MEALGRPITEFRAHNSALALPAASNTFVTLAA